MAKTTRRSTQSLPRPMRQGQPRQFDLRIAIFLAGIAGQTYSQFENKDGLFLVPRDYHLVGDFTAKAYGDSEHRFGFVAAIRAFLRACFPRLRLGC